MLPFKWRSFNFFIKSESIFFTEGQNSIELSLRLTTCVDLNIDHLSVNICLRRPELSKVVCVSLRFVMRTLSLSGGFIANFFIGGFSRTFGIVMDEFQKIFDCQSAYLTLAGGLIYTFMYTMCKLRSVTALSLDSFLS